MITELIKILLSKDDKIKIARLDIKEIDLIKTLYWKQTAFVWIGESAITYNYKKKSNREVE